ncbi:MULTISPECIES: IS110 family transposase [Pelosinus]
MNVPVPGRILFEALQNPKHQARPSLCSGANKKSGETFRSKPVISLESTGHYSARIVHFFLKQGFEVFLINPLISHSIKNSLVRKVKTDSVDACTF